MAELTWLRAPGTPDAWRALGFDVRDRCVLIGGIAVELGGEPAWGFDALDGDPAALGVDTRVVDAPSEAPVEHPNGVDRFDHVVYRVVDLDEAVAAVESVLALSLRRRFRPRGPEGPEMAFFRAGGCVIEVVGGASSPTLWGIALRAPDLDAFAAAVKDAGGPVGHPKPAVQGGRIVPVPTGHLGLPLAVLGP